MFYIKLICCLLFSFLQSSKASISAAESKVLNKCLERFGGLTNENAERLERYKQWSQNREEIPCFTNCYISNLFDFYNETAGFREDLIQEKFGKPLFDVCRDKLNRGRDKCERAFNGFHCLIRHEDDPFVEIDNMSHLHTDAKQAMKDCLYQFDPFEWNRLKNYSKFPVREPIPCYTKCFLDKLNLYDQTISSWRIADMRAYLGVPVKAADIRHCHSLSRRRHQNDCIWMYQEFTCFIISH